MLFKRTKLIDEFSNKEKYKVFAKDIKICFFSCFFGLHTDSDFDFISDGQFFETLKYD